MVIHDKRPLSMGALARITMAGSTTVVTLGLLGWWVFLDLVFLSPVRAYTNAELTRPLRHLSMEGPTDPHQLDGRYLERLGLHQEILDQEPTAEKLAILVEAHVRHIPFENLRLHVFGAAPVSLEVSALARHILDRQRGGLCYELNGLFSHFLQVLGYRVLLVPSLFHIYPEGGAGQPGIKPVDYRKHMMLTVQDVQQQWWYVDVGLGESPLGPLRYEMDTEQITAEGMRSRLREVHPGAVLLEWYRPQRRSWQTRLTWRSLDAHPPNHSSRARQLADFEYDLLETLEPRTIFRRMAIACKLTRQEKVTLVGNQLKRTINRFDMNPISIVKNLETMDEIQDALHREFGIHHQETSCLIIPGTREAEALR